MTSSYKEQNSGSGAEDFSAEKAETTATANSKKIKIALTTARAESKETRDFSSIFARLKKSPRKKSVSIL